jgi:hypothetical protein
LIGFARCAIAWGARWLRAIRTSISCACTFCDRGRCCCLVLLGWR